MSINLIQALSSGGVSYRVPPHKNVRRGWVGVDCPKCSPGSGKFRLGFELSSGRAHCWVCGSLFNVEILADLLKIPYKESAALLKTSPIRKVREESHTGRLTLPSGVGDLLPAHKNYIKNRGLDPDEISSIWKVQGIGPASRLQWRLFIPIHDRFGAMVSWTSRAIGKDNPVRYYSASESEEDVPHKSLLYGAHLARHAIVIVEGPVDAWSIGPGAVATCGVGFSQAQLSAMAEYPVRAVCFDAQEDAQRRAESLCRDLAAMPGQTDNIVLETGKDPAEADPEELEELRNQFFPELELV